MFKLFKEQEPPMAFLGKEFENSLRLHGDPRNGFPNTPEIDPETGECIGWWMTQERADEFYILNTS